MPEVWSKWTDAEVDALKGFWNGRTLAGRCAALIAEATGRPVRSQKSIQRKAYLLNLQPGQGRGLLSLVDLYRGREYKRVVDIAGRLGFLVRLNGTKNLHIAPENVERLNAALSLPAGHMNAKQAAKALGLSVGSVFRLVHEGALPSKRFRAREIAVDARAVTAMAMHGAKMENLHAAGILIGRDEAARLARVAASSIVAAIKAGELPGTEDWWPGTRKRWVIYRADLDAWIARRVNTEKEDHHYA